MTKSQRPDPLDRLRPSRDPTSATGDFDDRWVDVVDPLGAPTGDRDGPRFGPDGRGRHRSGEPPTIASTSTAGGARRTLVGAAAVLVVGVLVAGALLWWWALVQRPDQGIVLTAAPSAELAPAIPDPVASSLISATAGTTSVTASVTVHVAGAVADPGVVIVTSGARVLDAVMAAGGLTDTADPDAVNLARRVDDGEMIVVPTPGQVIPGQSLTGAGSGTGAVTGGVGGLVDLNRADVAALDALPGIGPVLAQRIVAHREDAGPFTAVDDLRAVPGIGEKVFGGLRDLVTV